MWGVNPFIALKMAVPPSTTPPTPLCRGARRARGRARSARLRPGASGCISGAGARRTAARRARARPAGPRAGRAAPPARSWPAPGRTLRALAARAVLELLILARPGSQPPCPGGDRARAGRPAGRGGFPASRLAEPRRWDACGAAGRAPAAIAGPRAPGLPFGRVATVPEAGCVLYCAPRGGGTGECGDQGWGPGSNLENRNGNGFRPWRPCTRFICALPAILHARLRGPSPGGREHAAPRPGRPRRAAAGADVTVLRGGRGAAAAGRRKVRKDGAGRRRSAAQRGAARAAAPLC
jgi:hypothetical protein